MIVRVTPRFQQWKYFAQGVSKVRVVEHLRDRPSWVHLATLQSDQFCAICDENRGPYTSDPIYETSCEPS